MTLDELEIRIHITMMELEEQFPKASSIVFNDRQNCFWVESTGFTSWPLLDPLEDDGVCFRLMLKHGIKLSRNRDKEYVAMYSHCRGEDDESPNKAVCLAIIEKSKQVKE